MRETESWGDGGVGERGDSICIDEVSAELKASCLKPGGWEAEEEREGIGGRNRRLEHKIRGERGRKLKDGQEWRERGQEVSKTVVISRQNTSPEKDTHAHTRGSSVG